MFENPRRGRQARNFFENSRSKIVFRTDILPKIVVGCSCLVITTYVGTLFILFLPGFLLWFPEGFFHTYFVEALIFFFFQASSFQLLKLENLLRWSFFSFIYKRSSCKNELFHIYFTLFHIYFTSFLDSSPITPVTWTVRRRRFLSDKYS